MGKFPIVIAVLSSMLAVCVGDVGNGYIFTCPRSLKIGAINEMQLRLFGKPSSGTLKIQVYCEKYDSNETLWMEKDYDIEGKSLTILNLLLVTDGLMDSTCYSGRVAINGTFADNRTIEGSDKVDFRVANGGMTIVQTDKPIYKIGQTVQFRIVRTDEKLKPLGKGEADVWVEDPKGMRLFQWKSVPIGKGIVPLLFQLSDEPEKGEWKIKVLFNGDIATATFDVKEYVLPKFDVAITIPPYVLADANTIPIKICAKYTYGKKVQGSLNMNVSFEKHAWNREKYPQLSTIDEIDGCYDYTINVSLIETEGYSRYRRLSIIVSVTEKGTGIQRNETKYIQRHYSPLTLNFDHATKQYFKPGIPYSGKMKVTHPDETPAEGEPCELCYTVSRERVLSDWWATRKVKYCRNYTSDADGVIDFIIPPQKTDSVSVWLEAKSLRYGGNPGSSRRDRVLNRPQTSMSLSPFFSPSGSFIHLQQVNNILSCGEKKTLTILFTAKENAEYTIYYQVMNRGKVILTDSVVASFSTEDDVSSRYQDEDKVINGQGIQIVPAPTYQSSEISSSSASSSSISSSEEDCPSAREARYVPYVGEVSVDIDVDFNLSPSFSVLAYYVRDDRETVADSQKFKVERCFNNKVRMSFGDEVKQPGTNTAVKVKASPNSLCGIKIVDKSISLLDASDPLTAEKVFNILEGMDTGLYYSTDPCNENKPQPGLYKSSSSDMILHPRPWGSSSYEDSLAAFMDSGLLVISNLVVITRPCKDNVGGGYGAGGYSSLHSGGSGPAQAFAMESSARRPAAPAAIAVAKMGAATKSVVDVRSYFPETWLFDMIATNSEGEYIAKEKLPHTITEWIGSAVCINAEDGLGISNDTSVKGFQAFFISFTLPYSVIRGESFWITVSIFNYVEDSLAITVSLENSEDYVVTSGSINRDICVGPGTSENLRIQLNATVLGQLNITVRAETVQSSDVCGSASVSAAVAKDGITNSLIVEAEGWPVEKVDSMLFCPKDEENEVFLKTLELNLPDDVVPQSARALVYMTGNVMGPSMDNLENLVTLPTGCGEQNMVKFVPNYLVLEYFSYTNHQDDKVKARALRNLNTGAQRQMNYRHSDGSFSAFGPVDGEGSMFLTAFVLRYFSQARKYISIDNRTISDMETWITSKQQPDGCFREVGKIFHSTLQGGIGKEKSDGPITAYAISSLMIAGYNNQTAIDAALSCMKQNDEHISPYSSFLYAYAEALAGKKDACNERITETRKGANNTGGVEYYNNIKGSKSKNLETAAYAVLSTLKCRNSGAEDVLAIIRYMTTNMSPRGGFISTQDTCVGLEALSEFAKLIFKNPLNIKVLTRGGWEGELQITEANRMLVNKRRISDLPSEVEVEATGSGCALLQKTLRYNSLTAPKNNLFNLEVVSECQNTDCKLGVINISASYIPEGKKSSMSLVEIRMLSGMVPVTESLEKLAEDPKLGLMRYDVENNVVVLYFYEITNVPKRISLQVKVVIEVENRQDASVKVYDYYEKDKTASQLYKMK